MDSLSQIMVYMIGTFLTFNEVNRLSLTSKKMNDRTKEAKKLLAKREVMRIFSSDLKDFRMIIPSVSYELEEKDYSTPTLNDGYDWQKILKEGLSIGCGMLREIKPQLRNSLPSFHSNNFSKLDTIMQERLYEESNPVPAPTSDIISPGIELDLDNFNELENIYLLHLYYYKHDASVAANSPKITKIAKFYDSFSEYVRFYCKIQRICIMGTFDEDKPIQFLYEYSIRWQAYSNYLWNLSAQLEKLEEKINKCYGESWPESPHQFRLYKLMTKIWNSEVNTKELIFNLKDCFISVLKTYHQDCLAHLRDKQVKKETNGMEAVLKMFFQALIDSSINKNTVHFIGSSGVTYEKMYNTFETILLKDGSGFLKTALEIGYQSKNLKAVWSIFEEYSKIIKRFTPVKTQKQFEKSKTEMVVKFIRFILSKRLKQFKSFDFSKIEAKWNASYETAMIDAFSPSNSVFLKTL